MTVKKHPIPKGDYAPPQSFHINYFSPNDVWPKGGWSAYAVNGDQIAERVIFKEIKQGNFGKFYSGGVVERHPWPGYIGTWGDPIEMMEFIRGLTAGEYSFR